MKIIYFSSALWIVATREQFKYGDDERPNPKYFQGSNHYTLKNVIGSITNYPKNVIDLITNYAR